MTTGKAGGHLTSSVYTNGVRLTLDILLSELYLQKMSSFTCEDTIRYAFKFGYKTIAITTIIALEGPLGCWE